MDATHSCSLQVWVTTHRTRSTSFCCLATPASSAAHPQDNKEDSGTPALEWLSFVFESRTGEPPKPPPLKHMDTEVRGGGEGTTSSQVGR